MIQLLNRLAWVLSLSFGLGVSSILNYSEGFFIFGIIGGFIIKQVFFSKSYIEARVNYFAEQVELRLSESTILNTKEKNNTKKEVLDKQQVSEVSDTHHTIKSDPHLDESSATYTTKQEEDTQEVEISKNYQALKNSQEDDEIKYQFQVNDALSKFFSENLLAKLGGILVFLGVFFFLALIYTVVGPVTKLMIGFLIGATTFGVGVGLNKRGYENESRIVLGTAILINYLVILGGRYLLGGGSETDNLLSVGLTFMFLILNTIFAVTTSLVYKSHTLLIFSFIFAYINPLLLGTQATEPYTLLGYTMIVTLGALYMSYSRKDIILFVLSYIFASVLFLGATSSDANGWIAKLLCINTLGAMSLYVACVFHKRYQYISELLIGASFLLIGLLGLFEITSLSLLQLAILGFSSLGLMLFSYISMNRGVYMYSIGTLGTVLVLTPALMLSGKLSTHIALSTSLVIVFACLNIGIILQKNKNLIAENIGNILGGLISGALFLSYIIYEYGNIYFPGILQGFAFFGLALIYILTAFFLVQKIGIEEMKSQEKYRNLFFGLSALGLSLFSLAVAFVFAEQKEIIALIWILESNILFYFAQKLRSQKIMLGALVLHIIGVVRLLPILDMPLSGNYGLLVTASMIGISLMWNLFMIMGKKNNQASDFIPKEFYGLHHFFHIIGVVTCSVLVFSIFDISSQWYLLLLASTFLAGLGYIYTLSGSLGLQRTHMIAYIIGLFLHITLFGDTMGRDTMNLGVSTLIIGVYALAFILEYSLKKSIENKKLLVVFLGYIFILSTLYVFHIFDSVFAITLYWGILSFVILSYGIQKDIIPLRTLGLYLISLTAGKVFFYDIWISMDDTISRVAALMVVGILMIILSTMYTKKYGNTLNREFNPENLFPKGKNALKTQIIPEKKETQSQETQKNKIQEDIESITIESDIIGVRMYITGTEKPIQIRAINLIKIAKLIEKTLKKTQFQAGELSDVYTLISTNYKSSLSTEQYTKIQEIVEAFVKHGGKMEFVRK